MSANKVVRIDLSIFDRKIEIIEFASICPLFAFSCIDQWTYFILSKHAISLCSISPNPFSLIFLLNIPYLYNVRFIQISRNPKTPTGASILTWTEKWRTRDNAIQRNPCHKLFEHSLIFGHHAMTLNSGWRLDVQQAATCWTKQRHPLFSFTCVRHISPFNITWYTSTVQHLFNSSRNICSLGLLKR